jgi:hypothetical protein
MWKGSPFGSLVLCTGKAERRFTASQDIHLGTGIIYRARRRLYPKAYGPTCKRGFFRLRHRVDFESTFDVEIEPTTT